MSAPDPEGFSLLTKIAAAAAAIVTPIYTAYKFIDYRLDKKADKDVVQASFTDLKGELTLQREDIGRLSSKIDEGEKVSEERHRELLMHLLERK